MADTTDVLELRIEPHGDRPKVTLRVDISADGLWVAEAYGLAVRVLLGSFSDAVQQARCQRPEDADEMVAHFESRLRRKPVETTPCQKTTTPTPTD